MVLKWTVFQERPEITKYSGKITDYGLNVESYKRPTRVRAHLSF
jgi:hypothetical protein